MLEFDSGEYESICIFAEKSDDRDGWICLEGPGGKEQQVHMNDDWYRLVQLALPEKGIYRISRKGVSFTQKMCIRDRYWYYEIKKYQDQSVEKVF